MKIPAKITINASCNCMTGVGLNVEISLNPGSKEPTFKFEEMAVLV